MRILLISWEYPPYVVGGMGRHVAELVPALSRLSVAGEPLYVDVVTPRYAGGKPIEQLNERVTIYRVDAMPLSPLDHYNSVIAGNSTLIAQARKLIRKHDYDVIHIHDWLTATAGVALKHEHKLPLVTTIHATERGRHQGYLPSDTSRQINRLEWQACYESWRVVACSNFMRQELQSYFGVPSDKVTIIVNAIDFDVLHYASPETARALRQRYGPNGEKLIFFVGRITHEKGLHVLIRAVPKILDKYPNTRVLAAGKNSEKMWPMAHELGIGRAMTFLGYISDEKRDHLYQTVDVAVFPSLYEPFGIVALEAMALGCNVIASDVGGLGEVVQHRQNGLTVYPNDPDSITWGVDYLFSHPLEAQRMRDLARQQTHLLYNWDKIARQTVALYQQVAAERRRVRW
jgi:glycosyltransferase involved in cell wall biosynthesis